MPRVLVGDFELMSSTAMPSVARVRKGACPRGVATLDGPTGELDGKLRKPKCGVTF